MKKSEFRSLIREEIKKILNENVNPDAVEHAARIITFPIQPRSEAAIIFNRIVDGGPYKTDKDLIKFVFSLVGSKPGIKRYLDRMEAALKARS